MISKQPSEKVWTAPSIPPWMLWLPIVREIPCERTIYLRENEAKDCNHEQNITRRNP